MGRAATSSTRLACRERLVSALVPSTTEQDRVRELQRALYRAAKADPRRRFHALYDKLSRRDVLERAWGQVRANRGAAGIDRITLADVEQYGSARLLDELAADLRDGRYRPLPARRVFIPKPGAQERRRAAGAEEGERADLRGRLPALLLRLSPQEDGARCPAGTPRRVLPGQTLGGGDGHRQLLRGDPARAVAAGDRGA